jgi:serine phosphatase RsbU (regulator of sigma subunit)
LVATNNSVEVIPGQERPIGLFARTRPWTTEIPIGPGLRVVLISDGISGSGVRQGHPPLRLDEILAAAGPDVSAAEIADMVLAAAIERDKGRPGDDMSVVALTLPRHEQATLVRRMRAEVPLP